MKLLLSKERNVIIPFSSVAQSCLTPWTAARQASLSITNSWSLLKLMSTELVMPSNHLNLCCPLLILPSIFPSIRVFSNESVLHVRWPQYWSFCFRVFFYHMAIKNPYNLRLTKITLVKVRCKRHQEFLVSLVV